MRVLTGTNPSENRTDTSTLQSILDKVGVVRYLFAVHVILSCIIFLRVESSLLAFFLQAYITLVPGILTISLLDIKIDSIGKWILYSVGISWLQITFLGFVTNLFVRNPFIKGAVNLSIIILVTSLFCVYFVKHGAYDNGSILMMKESIRVEELRNQSLILPLYVYSALAILSVVLITYGYNTSKFSVHVAVAVLVPMAPLILHAHRKVSSSQYLLLPLCVLSSSLLFLRSLQGKYVNGYDIMNNLAHVKLTLSSQQLLLSEVTSNYSNSLTTNILPIYYHHVSSSQPYLFYKITLPLVFGTVMPVATYQIYQNVELPQFGVIASIMLVLFDANFFPKLPGVQKVMLSSLFFILMLVSYHDKKRHQNRVYSFLAIAFGYLIVVTHFTTTWMLLPGLIGSYAIVLILQHIGISVKPVIGKTVLATIGIISTFWYLIAGKGELLETGILIAVGSLRTLYESSSGGSTVASTASGLSAAIGTMGILALKVTVVGLICVGLTATFLRHFTTLFRADSSFDSTEKDYRMGYLFLSSLMIFGAGLFVFGRLLGLARYLYLIVLVSSPFAIKAIVETNNLLPPQTPSSKKIITVLVVVMFIFNSGAVSQVVDGEELSVYGTDEVQITDRDIKTVSFMLSHRTSRFNVIGGQYVGLKFRGGYALSNGKLERSSVVNLPIRNIRIPFSNLPDGYIYINNNNIESGYIRAYKSTTASGTVKTGLISASIFDSKSDRNKIYENGGGTIYY